MGIWAWIVLLIAAAGVGTVVQFAFFRKDRGPTDYDWVYTAGGALVGGFTGHAWYSVGPTFDGLNVLPAVAGLILGAAIVEGAYRLVLRPRQRQGR